MKQNFQRLLMAGMFFIFGWFNFTTTVAAQESDNNGTPPANPADDWTEIEITPRAITQPWLQYRLYPDQYELVEGNAATILLRMAWEKQPSFWKNVSSARKMLKQSDEEFSPEKARAEVPLADYSELRRAALRKHASWEYPLGEQPAIGILLPDVQGMRSFLTMLSLHARADIAEGKIDEGMEKIAVGLAVSRHVGATPFVVCKLVQRITTEYFIDRIQQLVAHRSSPNLYWALGNMPSPLVDLRASIDLERRIITGGVPELEDLDRERSQQEWEAAAAKLMSTLSLLSGDTNRWIKEQGGIAKVQQEFIERARKRLPELLPELAEKVAGMSDEEVAVRYFVEHASIVNDVQLALIALPPVEGFQFIDQMNKQFEAIVKQEPISALTAIGSARIYGNGWSIQRRLAALRTVELLRDYAARNGNKLPEKLEDITDWPIPLDPFTGKYFQYERIDGSARLTGEPIRVSMPDHIGWESDEKSKPQFGIRNLIQIRE